MRWWAILFWIYAIVSVGYFIYRRVSASRRGAAPQQRSDVAGSTERSRPGPQEDAPVERVWPAPPPLDPGDDTFRLPVEGHDGPAPDLGSEPGAEATDPPPPMPSPSPATTLPELLSGITLPHELVPLTQTSIDIDLSTHVVVSTTKAPAQVVREGLTAELERLGYDVEQESMLTLVATGPRGRVTVQVHADGSTVQDGGTNRFPTAAPGSVVAEIFAR